MQLGKTVKLEETVEQISDLIKKNIQQIEQEAMPAVRKEINYIINNRVDSIEDIERVLDILLDYIHVGCGIKEFRKLNSYYAAVDKENSETYTRFYEEIIGDNK